jgi:hypothetical protein
MKTIQIFLAVVALAAVPVFAEEPPAPGAAAAPPAAERKAPPKEPAGRLATRIDESLAALINGSAAGHAVARASLKTAIDEWREAVKDDPLRARDWWQAALARTLPAGSAKKTGIFEEKLTHTGDKEALLHVSIPKAYSGKTAWPMVVRILGKDEDPKRTFPLLYGDLLKDFLVVGIPTEGKGSLDLKKEPWLTGLALKYAVETYHIDRNRVFLDGSTSMVSTVFRLGSEWSVHFAGCVLRNPSGTHPMVRNLAIGSLAVVAPAAETETVMTLQETIPSLHPIIAPTVATSVEAGATEVQKWMKAAPPRALTRDGTPGVKWSTLAEGGEVWCYWLWMFRATAGKPNRVVEIDLAWDVASNTAKIRSRYLSEAILLLHDGPLDLDREVTIEVNGKQAWKGKVERSIDRVLFWIGQTGERTLFTTAEIRFTVPRDALEPLDDGSNPFDEWEEDDEAAPTENPPPPPPPPPPTPPVEDTGKEAKPVPEGTTDDPPPPPPLPEDTDGAKKGDGGGS